MKFYLVTTKCGHVGKLFYIPITFPVRADDAKEAASIARRIPRVKHHHWDAILECREVNGEEFQQQIFINDSDPYLLAKTSHEQDLIFDQIKDRLVRDNHQEELAAKRHKKSSKPNLVFQSMKYRGGYDFEYECLA